MVTRLIRNLRGLRFSFSTVPGDYIISIVGPYNTRTHFTGEPLLSVVLAINIDKRLKEDLLVFLSSGPEGPPGASLMGRKMRNPTPNRSGFLEWIGVSSLSMYFVLRWCVVETKVSSLAMIDYPMPLLNSMLVPPSIYKASGRGTDTSKEFNLIILQFYFP